MKALVYNKNLKNKIQLQDRNIPRIRNPKDAIVRVTASTICTSDLHIISGVVPRANNDIILGHEFVGEIVDIGCNVMTLKKGDRVAANCITYCGECYFCKKGYINNCIRGGWELGCRIDGCQCEYVRVPYADTGLIKIPDNVSFESALFTGDILSSGYFAALMCEIKPNDTIAVIGSGSTGLCSMMCARYLGAATIIAIDINETRLKLAKDKNLADITINPKFDNTIDLIKKYTNNIGTDGVIEAAGNNETFELAWKIARPNSIVGILAMYEENQILPLPVMYGKNLTFKTGGVDSIHCKELLKLISENKISTDFLITHKFSLEEIEDAYKLFKSKPDNCLKVVIYN